MILNKLSVFVLDPDFFQNICLTCLCGVLSNKHERMSQIVHSVTISCSCFTGAACCGLVKNQTAKNFIPVLDLIGCFLLGW
jgi:hypothetical protein